MLYDMKDNLIFKNFEITQHKSDESGNMEITGYGAVFGNEDSAGDIIEKGAFAKTLIERAGRIAFCYQHDIWNPIGKLIEIREDEKGLWIKVMLSASEKNIQTKVKEDILKEMSIGYRVMASREEVRNGETVNILSEIKLFEISLVTIAANPLALVESMKSEKEREQYLEKEFDRLIAIVKNENINFEIQKLKSIVLSSVPAPQKPEPRHEKHDKSVVFGDTFFTNELN